MNHTVVSVTAVAARCCWRHCLLRLFMRRHRELAMPGARDYARNASRQGQVVGRGLFGGLLGAGIGAAAGGAGTGAAIGGGVGALSGAHARQRTADKIYWAAYRDCMAGRVR